MQAGGTLLSLHGSVLGVSGESEEVRVRVYCSEGGGEEGGCEGRVTCIGRCWGNQVRVKKVRVRVEVRKESPALVGIGDVRHVAIHASDRDSNGLVLVVWFGLVWFGLVWFGLV